MLFRSIDSLMDKVPLPAAGPTLNPGESIYAYASFDGEVSEELQQAVADEESCILIFGRVVYMDCFGKEREACFCHYYTGRELGPEALRLHAPANKST